MRTSGQKLPKDVIASWPEIFGEVKLRVLPLKYLNTVIINFKDGKSWEIKLSSKIKNSDWDHFEKSLYDLFSTYERTIEDIDFKLDTQKVKNDIEKVTTRFLKKRKL